MGLHRSGVNFHNLIRDLAEMYPFPVAEVVLVELVANALDASAETICVTYDRKRNVLVVEDNGKGMTGSQFDEYHDFAAGLKRRGDGIGFAGVGAKISFNIAERVVTETRSASYAGGSDWQLKSVNELVWEDMQSLSLRGHGTRVEVHFTAQAAPHYSETQDIVSVLRRHYLPLFDSRFLDLYSRIGRYSQGMEFCVNGVTVRPGRVVSDFGLASVREFTPCKRGKKVGYGLFGLASSEYPLGEDLAGILLCTHGKVIKPELFNQFPGSLGPRIFGLVEVPELISFLTTSKTEFMRTSGKHQKLEGIYEPIRREFRDWLAEIGVQPLEITDVDEARKLERELHKLLQVVPELTQFFGFRHKADVLKEQPGGRTAADLQDGTEPTLPVGEGKSKGADGVPGPGDGPGAAPTESPDTGQTRAEPISRTAKRGPRIGFVSAPERTELAWVEGNCVYVNSGHPAYQKAKANPRVRWVHCLFAIGTAVQRFLLQSEQGGDGKLVDRLMAAWGAR